MKIQFRFLALLLSTLLISGCAACPKKTAVATKSPVSTAKKVAAPVTPKAAKKTAPVASAKPVAKKIPAAVLK